MFSVLNIEQYNVKDLSEIFPLIIHEVRFLTCLTQQEKRERGVWVVPWSARLIINNAEQDKILLSIIIKNSKILDEY